MMAWAKNKTMGKKTMGDSWKKFKEIFEYHHKVD